MSHERDRRAKCAEQRKPVSRPNDQVGEHKRPALEDEHIEKTVEGTGSLRLAAKVEKRRLKREACQDRDKIQPSRPETPRSEGVQGVAETRQKAKRRRDEQKTVHGFKHYKFMNRNGSRIDCGKGQPQGPAIGPHCPTAGNLKPISISQETE